MMVGCWLVVVVLGAARGGPSDHVDVFVGTVKTGNTFPGATWPHGMTQLSPVLEPPPGRLWHYNSGYHRDEAATRSRAFGVGHTALSGTGLNDGGDFIVRPCERRAWLDHASEAAAPGSYEATFACGDGGAAAATIKASASERGGVFEVWHDGDSDVVSLYLDLDSPLDATVEASAKVKGNRAGKG